LAKLLEQENYHVMAAKLKPGKASKGHAAQAAPAPNPPWYGVLVSVNPDFVPEEDETAFDAVVAALEYFEIPAQLNEGWFAPVPGNPVAGLPSPFPQGSAEKADLENQRKSAADFVYEMYEFGEGIRSVEGVNGWESDTTGNWSRTVFVSLPDDPADAPTHVVKLAVTFIPGTAEVAQCVALLEGKPIGEAVYDEVSAEVHSDDYAFTAKFDAAPWFAQASDAEILALRDVEWRGDYEADVVAQHFESRNTEIADVFKYCLSTQGTRRALGFEVSVDEGEAMSWLKLHRHSLWAIMVCDARGVDLVEAQEPEIAGMWDWLDDQGNACACSFDTEIEAALDAVKVLGL
jgi:hypothetical protein